MLETKQTSRYKKRDQDFFSGTKREDIEQPLEKTDTG